MYKIPQGLLADVNLLNTRINYKNAIQNTINRFFGLSVEPQNTDILTFSDHWEEAIGNSIIYFSITDEMLEYENERYTVSFSSYSYSKFDTTIPLENVYAFTDEELLGQAGKLFRNSENLRENSLSIMRYA